MELEALDDGSLMDTCHPVLNCSSAMNTKQLGEFKVVAILRLFTACLSILGSCSIILSALYRKTVCNPKVHPIFVLSIADLMLSMMWVSGAAVWLEGGLKHHHSRRVGCYTINLMTVILQCVVMNVTLIYALLAYSSIKQRDFSGVYMIQQRPVSIHIWPPVCSVMAYCIAWILPIILIMIPFGVISAKYGIVRKANDYSCWCLPYYGNVLPRPPIDAGNYTVRKHYLQPLHYFISSYACILSVNFCVVFICMAITYYKVFIRIRRMRQIQEQNENAPLYGATQAMILEGQKDARKRVLLFLFFYFLTGIMIVVYGMWNIYCQMLIMHEPENKTILHHEQNKRVHKEYIFLLFEAMSVPLQGFLNAVAYGWTRGDFLNVMSSNSSRFGFPRRGSYPLSYDTMEEREETVADDDGDEWEREEIRRTGNSILFSGQHEVALVPGESRSKQEVASAMTPGSPGYFLGD